MLRFSRWGPTTTGSSVVDREFPLDWSVTHVHAGLENEQYYLIARIQNSSCARFPQTILHQRVIQRPGSRCSGLWLGRGRITCYGLGDDVVPAV